MLLTEADRAEATAALARAGIIGSDARTCLDQIGRRAPDVPLDVWRSGLRLTSEALLADRYGTDAIRAVLALRA